MPQIYTLSLTKEEWEIVAKALTFTETRMSNFKRMLIHEEENVLETMNPYAPMTMKEIATAIKETIKYKRNYKR